MRFDTEEEARAFYELLRYNLGIDNTLTAAAKLELNRHVDGTPPIA